MGEFWLKSAVEREGFVNQNKNLSNLVSLLLCCLLMLIFPQIEKKNTRLSKFQQSQKKFIRFAQSTFFLPNYIFGLRDQKRRPRRGFRPTRIDVKIEIGKASKGTRPLYVLAFICIFTL